jgi:HK97 gp10 family phage protein
MSNPVTVKITGLEQLSQRMQEFPDQLVRKGVRVALLAGGEVLRQEISDRAPRSLDETHGHEPGFLADHIAAKLSTSPKQDKGSVKVGPVAKAFWGMFAEFGTRFQPALPFVRPAFESAGQRALDAFVAKLREAFQEVLGS